MGRVRIATRWTVDPLTGCWLWQLKIGRSGYGDCWDGSSVRKAHRVVYEEHHGPIPAGLELDHLCRNRACVNPDHLEPVTRTQNIRRSPVAKLTAEQVIALRADHARGLNYRELAVRYGLSRHSIGNIVRGETWRIEMPHIQEKSSVID